MTDKSTRIKKIALFKITRVVLYTAYIIILLTRTGNIHILRTARWTTCLIVEKGMYMNGVSEWVGGYMWARG